MERPRRGGCGLIFLVLGGSGCDAGGGLMVVVGPWFYARSVCKLANFRCPNQGRPSVVFRPAKRVGSARPCGGTRLADQGSVWLKERALVADIAEEPVLSSRRDVKVQENVKLTKTVEVEVDRKRTVSEAEYLKKVHSRLRLISNAETTFEMAMKTK